MFKKLKNLENHHDGLLLMVLFCFVLMICLNCTGGAHKYDPPSPPDDEPEQILANVTAGPALQAGKIQVEGYLKNRDGSPVANVLVIAENMQNGDLVSGKTDKNGFFSLLVSGNSGDILNIYSENTAPVVIHYEDNDSDGDAIADSIDNCPQVSNPEQSDVDADTIGNSCDNCPEDANPECPFDNPGKVPVYGAIMINEVVTEPVQDWSDSAGGRGAPFDDKPGNAAAGIDDEYIELFINQEGLDLTTGYRITVKNDMVQDPTGGIDFQGSINSDDIKDRAFSKMYYSSANGGSLSYTMIGDYLVLGNPSGAADTGFMSNNVYITLQAGNQLLDDVELGYDAEGDKGDTSDNAAPDGRSYGNTSQESVARRPNARDTDNDESDFKKQAATPGISNDIKEAEILIKAIYPKIGPVGSSNWRISIYGDDFDANTTVGFSATGITVTQVIFINDQYPHLDVSVNIATTTPPAWYDLQVVTATGRAVAPRSFQVLGCAGPNESCPANFSGQYCLQSETRVWPISISQYQEGSRDRLTAAFDLFPTDLNVILNGSGILGGTDTIFSVDVRGVQADGNKIVAVLYVKDYAPKANPATQPAQTLDGSYDIYKMDPNGNIVYLEESEVFKAERGSCAK
jgi:hypothetical protein